MEVAVAHANPINIDHGHPEARRSQQLSERRSGDPWMGARDNSPLSTIRLDQGGAQRRQAVASGDRADQESLRTQRPAQQLQGKGQFVDRIQRPDRYA